YRGAVGSKNLHGINERHSVTDAARVEAQKVETENQQQQDQRGQRPAHAVGYAVCRTLRDDMVAPRTACQLSRTRLCQLHDPVALGADCLVPIIACGVDMLAGGHSDWFSLHGSLAIAHLRGTLCRRSNQYAVSTLCDMDVIAHRTAGVDLPRAGNTHGQNGRNLPQVTSPAPTDC